MRKPFDIFFSDLNENAQKRLLDYVGAREPQDMNWDGDIFPIAMYDYEPERFCLYEPVMGQYPPNSLCSGHPGCVGCSYCYFEREGEKE